MAFTSRPVKAIKKTFTGETCGKGLANNDIRCQQSRGLLLN